MRFGNYKPEVAQLCDGEKPQWWFTWTDSTTGVDGKFLTVLSDRLEPPKPRRKAK